VDAGGIGHTASIPWIELKAWMACRHAFTAKGFYLYRRLLVCLFRAAFYQRSMRNGALIEGLLVETESLSRFRFRTTI
jgi:hypothetical protein